MPGHHWNRSGLLGVLPAELPSTSSESHRQSAHNTKTVVVVPLARVVPVTIGGTAIPRIVVPGAAALLFCLSQSQSTKFDFIGSV